jgi:hypothetical protein
MRGGEDEGRVESANTPTKSVGIPFEPFGTHAFSSDSVHVIFFHVHFYPDTSIDTAGGIRQAVERSGHYIYTCARHQ